MKKLLVLLSVVLMLGFSPDLMAATEAEAGETDILETLKYAAYGLVALLSGSGLMLSRLAKKKIKELTPDEASEIFVKTLDKVAGMPSLVSKLIKALLTTDEGKKAYSLGQEWVLGKIDEVEAQIADLESKLELYQGEVSQEKISRYVKAIDNLRKEKERLQKLADNDEQTA